MGDITIRNARTHNLKGIDVTIPRDSLTVITGLSGSGKSSLAFDTLYAEGQRRYVESLSAYARQFLDRMQKPLVDKIEGLSPAISIEQHTTGGNPRSIVATVTEIHDYLRLLYGNSAVAQHAQYRQQVGSRLAGTRLCHTDEVAPLKQRRDGVFLNGSAGGEVHCIECIEHIVIEVEIVKVQLSREL